MTVKPIPDLTNPNSISTLPEPISGPESISKSLSASFLPGRYDDLAALCLAVARVGTTLEWDPLLKEILEAAVGLLKADSGALMFVDEAAGDLHVAAASNLPNAVLTQARAKIGARAVGRAAQQSQPFLLERAQIAELPEAFPKDRIVSSVCSPIRLQSGVATELLGVLVLNRHIGGTVFSSDEVRLVSAYSAHVSRSVQNARSYRRMQRRAVHLENLIAISQNLNTNLQADVILRSIVDRAVELVGCEAGSLLLIDADTQELVFRVAVGPVGAQLINKKLPPGVGIAGTVARGGKPLIVNDAKSDPRHYAEIDARTALVTKTILCVPLMNKGRILGVVELLNKVNGMPFDDDDRDVLAAFATQGAIALENARLYSDLRNAFADTVRIIVNALDARDTYTAGHTGRVTETALATAREMNWSQEQIDILQIGALLHDIGKIGIADSILYKPTELTQDEYGEMMRHPILGAKMLEGVAALRPMLPYILYHQERYDGLGYPFGLKGNEIPPEGRILAVADTFDAMTSNRPYRQGLSESEAIAEILRNRGTQFDPDVVDALQRAWQKKQTRPAPGN